MRRLVCGLGTGRCATASLARLLAAQHGWRATHEHKPVLSWNPADEPRPERHFDDPCYPLRADVGFYYLPHVRRLAELYGEAIRFVCLRREREATVASFLRYGEPQWFTADDPHWGRAFPTHAELSFREALVRYWDAYYAESERLAADLGDRFRIFELEQLNHEAGVREILSFARVEDPQVHIGIHVHRS